MTSWNGWYSYPVKNQYPSYTTYDWQDLEYMSIVDELQDIAWKLYDLADDFKKLEGNASQINSEKYAKEDSSFTKASSTAKVSKSTRQKKIRFEDATTKNSYDPTLTRTQPECRCMSTKELREELFNRLGKACCVPCKDSFKRDYCKDCTKGNTRFDNREYCSICKKYDCCKKYPECFDLKKTKTYVLENNECKIIICPK